MARSLEELAQIAVGKSVVDGTVSELQPNIKPKEIRSPEEHASVFGVISGLNYRGPVSRVIDLPRIAETGDACYVKEADDLFFYMQDVWRTSAERASTFGDIRGQSLKVISLDADSFYEYRKCLAKSDERVGESETLRKIGEASGKYIREKLQEESFTCKVMPVMQLGKAGAVAFVAGRQLGKTQFTTNRVKVMKEQLEEEPNQDVTPTKRLSLAELAELV